jgi:hypothetical protein
MFSWVGACGRALPTKPTLAKKAAMVTIFFTGTTLLSSTSFSADGNSLNIIVWQRPIAEAHKQFGVSDRARKSIMRVPHPIHSPDLSLSDF